MQGYIMLHRKIVNWEWYTETNTKALFIHLLLMANHADEKWRGEIIKRGTLITSYGSLSAQTGLSVQQIRTCLKNLEKTGDITRQATQRNTLIIVTKYDFYQSFINESTNESTDFQQTDNTPINKPTNKQSTTNKNDNKLNIYSPVSDDADLSVSENIPYVEIIDHLNSVAGTHYKANSSKTKTKIHARWLEGYRKEDFFTVIDVKCSEWLGNDMEKYLRPETLFGSKFEGYLNQVRKKESDPYGSMPYV